MKNSGSWLIKPAKLLVRTGYAEGSKFHLVAGIYIVLPVIYATSQIIQTVHMIANARIRDETILYRSKHRIRILYLLKYFCYQF